MVRNDGDVDAPDGDVAGSQTVVPVARPRRRSIFPGPDPLERSEKRRAREEKRKATEERRKAKEAQEKRASVEWPRHVHSCLPLQVCKKGHPRKSKVQSVCW